MKQQQRVGKQICCYISFMLRERTRIARKCKGSVGDNSPIYGRKNVKYPFLKATISGLQGFQVEFMPNNGCFPGILSSWWFQPCKIRIKWESFPNRCVFLIVKTSPRNHTAYDSQITSHLKPSSELNWLSQLSFLGSGEISPPISRHSFTFGLEIQNCRKNRVEKREGFNGFTPFLFTCRGRVTSLVLQALDASYWQIVLLWTYFNVFQLDSWWYGYILYPQLPKKISDYNQTRL